MTRMMFSRGAMRWPAIDNPSRNTLQARMRPAANHLSASYCLPST
jgi:hypothetical protein